MVKVKKKKDDRSASYSSGFQKKVHNLQFLQSGLSVYKKWYQKVYISNEPLAAILVFILVFMQQFLEYIQNKIFHFISLGITKLGQRLPLVFRDLLKLEALAPVNALKKYSENVNI